MQSLIEQFRRYPTTNNARRVRQYFERNPSRVWVVRGNDLLCSRPPAFAASVIGIPSKARRDACLARGATVEAENEQTVRLPVRFRKRELRSYMDA